MESLDTFEPIPTQDEKNIALLCHIGTFFGGIIVPLVVWLLKKNESSFISHHAKESINFQISILIYFVAAFVLVFFIIGILAIALLGLISFILIIVATVEAAGGKYYKYPFTIRLIR